MPGRCAVIAVVLLLVPRADAQDWSLSENPNLASWFGSEVAAIEQRTDLRKYATLEEWQAARPELRRQLREMLGLDPHPERTELNARVTGTTEEDGFVVENLHFESRPGLYVTANLYRPREVTEPLPAVLYVCGHGGVKKNGISYGNKTHYHHHGCWFARNGYVCLTIDSLQLGEIEAIHHGTYRYDRWWWNARGYTPAGVEAWNCVRALDYLQSRPEVDGARLGVTGRSGGGAYSWWIAAIDERVQCAVPVAGITTLRNHVVDGCVEGHCDCMFMVNTYRWDYATVAALVAPRPLLISNSDKDRIFPLDGVQEIHRQTAHIYALYDASDQLGLNITEGPHKDTQELRINAFHWLNRWLKQDESLVETTAIPFFEPETLRVFSELPGDEVNTRIDQSFVPAATAEESRSLSPEEIRERLRTKCFAAWPDLPPAEIADADVTQLSPPRSESAADDRAITQVNFASQPYVPLSLTIEHAADTKLSDVRTVRLIVLGSDERPSDVGDGTNATDADSAVAVFYPRGTGPAAWKGNEKKQTQIRRRFQLVGTTMEAMQVWDIRRAVQILRSACGDDVRITLRAAQPMQTRAACAALFESLAPPPAESAPSGSEIGVLNLTKTIALEILFRSASSETAGGR